jgi:hypothetical protein
MEGTTFFYYRKRIRIDSYVGWWMDDASESHTLSYGGVVVGMDVSILVRRVCVAERGSPNDRY